MKNNGIKWVFWLSKWRISLMCTTMLYLNKFIYIYINLYMYIMFSFVLFISHSLNIYFDHQFSLLVLYFYHLFINVKLKFVVYFIYSCSSIRSRFVCWMWLLTIELVCLYLILPGLNPAVKHFLSVVIQSIYNCLSFFSYGSMIRC